MGRVFPAGHSPTLPADCAQGVLQIRGSSRESLGKPSPGLLRLQSSGSGSFLVCCKNMSGFAHLLYSFLPPSFSRVKERAGQRPGEQARSNLSGRCCSHGDGTATLLFAQEHGLFSFSLFIPSTQTPGLLSPWLILPAPPPGFLCGRAGSLGGSWKGRMRPVRVQEGHRIPACRSCLLVSCPSLSALYNIRSVFVQ